MKDAKGHGSNAHNAGIANLKNSQLGIKLHPNVFAAVKANPGGFSVKPTTGQMPTSGYMVSIPGHTQIVDNATPENVAAYANAHAVALKDPAAHIGGWTDSDSGKTYLDVSHNIGNRSRAVQLGVLHNQKAIWDVKGNREIDTGGDGT
jgi:hypothetical protein